MEPKRLFSTFIWLLIFLSVSANLFLHCDGRKLVVLSRVSKQPKKIKALKHTFLEQMMTQLNLAQQLDSSSPLPPYNSLSPMENAPPSCVNPPNTPTNPLGNSPPSSTYPGGLSPPPGPTTSVPNPPEISNPSPSGSVPNPPETVPGPPETFPSPNTNVPGTPESSNPNPPGSIPSPPEIVPSPPETIPSPDTGFPGPPTPNVNPSPPGPNLGPPYNEPGPPTSVPSPPGGFPSPTGVIPNPPVFLPPVVFPPPTTPPSPTRTPNTALWCVAKPSVPDPIIQEAMNYACASGADCNSIQPDGPCFKPNTLLAHASFAFNSYWQRTKASGGSCTFGDTAILVTVDPSYDGCRFEYF